MQINVNICTQFLPDSLCSFSIQAMPRARRQAGPGRSLLPAERVLFDAPPVCKAAVNCGKCRSAFFHHHALAGCDALRGREMQPVAGPHVRSGRRRQVRDPRWMARLPTALRTCRGSTEGGGVIRRTAAA